MATLSTMATGAPQISPQIIPQPQQLMQQIPINPALQELLDALPHTNIAFTIATQPIPNTVPPQTNNIVVCPPHQAPQCDVCGVDFNGLNYMHQFLKSAPPEAIPPPPNMAPPPQRAQAIKSAKEAGNVAFKVPNYPMAIQQYSKSADMALSRPPWELAALSRDETCIALCNRSAAFANAGAWTNALADAVAVVTLKRPWTKGHFRKSRALVGLNRLEDARDAIVDGLQFEPNDKELNAFLKEIDDKLKEAEEA